jgi:lipid-A-disaccharide synthase
MVDSRGTPKILVVAAEASGDMHAARVVRQVSRLRPEVEFYGIGGDAMAEAGVHLVYHARDLAVVGISEILSRAVPISRALGWVRRTLLADRPDLAVLVDFPDFNLRAARHAVKARVPVVYYISPQIWAWRRGRIRQIRRTVSKMLVIFPFEEELYKRHGVPAEWVGHPLMDAWQERDRASSEAQFLEHETFGLSPLYPVVGLLPGSRASEVRSLLPTILEAAQLLRQRHPHVQFLLFEAPGLPEDLFSESLRRADLPVVRARSEAGRAMPLCDIAVVASGTATLELALHGIPMVVVYKVSRATFLLGRLLVRVPSIALVNLVCGRPVVPELLQGELDARNLAGLCHDLLTRSLYRSEMKRTLSQVPILLGPPGASERAARAIVAVLDPWGSRPEDRPNEGEVLR